MNKPDKSSVVEEVIAALDRGNILDAINIAKQKYPWESVKVPKRRMTQRRALSVFINDGFIDRYSGSKLIFPGTLLLLGYVLPQAFPVHETWRVHETHEIYFDLWPVVDHIMPISRGGIDNESNFATTSNLNNDVKSHWTLEQMGWTLHPPGKASEWDGLMTWFLEYVNSHQEVLEHRTISGWHKSAMSVRSDP